MKNLLTFLFSFKGTINRKQYLIAFSVIFIIIFVALGFYNMMSHNFSNYGTFRKLLFYALPPLILSTYISLISFSWRRLEDMGRGKCWILFLVTPGWFLVPILLSIFPSKNSN
jgi:uncharacterized membrane protein YhaH (DUF805 family)